MQILAISGSLRAASVNSAFCRAAAVLAAPGSRVEVFPNLGNIPLFNPDSESAPPAAVQIFREAVRDASALIIASPEYAHGVSGVMKNALDWLVSYEGAVNKPVAVVNTSARARHAHDSLKEILATMSLDVVLSASVTLPLLGVCANEQEMMSSVQVSRVIRDVLDGLASHVAGLALPGPNFPVS